MNSKLKSLKIKPRLTTSRGLSKPQENENTAIKKENNETINKEHDKVEPIVEPEPERVFSPPTKVPRIEQPDNSQIINKFLKPKPTPRLNVIRSSQKLPESKDSPKKYYEVQQPSPVPSEPDPVFSPPPVPIHLNSPMRPRSDTPRDFLQSPTYIVNHNIHHPPSAQSPFLPIPHARIRTESLCSNKSIPANLQPRKKFRNEDQKIIDNKRESRERLSNKNVEKSQLRMFDMIYYNPSTNPMKTREVKEQPPDEKEEKINTFKEPEEPIKKSNVPQLRLNADGELVLDESSLVVENEEHRKNRILLANTNVVYHDEHSSNYGFYKRQKRTKDWPQEETVKFYRCLNTIGTDFSLMLNLFPTRTRRDLKLKFKKEERINPGLVDKALLKFNSFDIEELQRELDNEEEQKRKDSENGSSEVKEIVKRKILKKQEAKAKAQQRAPSKIEKILSEGDEIIQIIDSNASKVDVKENLIESEEMKIKKAIMKRKPKPNIAVTSKRVKPSTDEHYSIAPIEAIDSGVKIEHCDMKMEEKKASGVIQESFMENQTSTSEKELTQPQKEIEIDLETVPIAFEESSVSQEKLEAETSQDSAFDEESFLNSLNLEQLSIVIRVVNGENIYDIHETDPNTQLISDKPLNLPAEFKNMLISLITQED